MLQLHQEYPAYDFAQHKGYGVPAHLEALSRLGPCAAHRRSFQPVRGMTGWTREAQLAQEAAGGGGGVKVADDMEGAVEAQIELHTAGTRKRKTKAATVTPSRRTSQQPKAKATKKKNTTTTTTAAVLVQHEMHELEAVPAGKRTTRGSNTKRATSAETTA
jgi:hypothetical protein